MCVRARVSVCVFLSVVTLYTVLYVPVLNNCNVFMFL